MEKTNMVAKKKAASKPLGQPKGIRPDKPLTCKFVACLNKANHTALKRDSKATNQSVNTLINDIIAERYAKDDDIKRKLTQLIRKL